MDDFVDDAITRGDSPLLAAFARATSGVIPARAHATLACLQHDGVVVAHAAADDAIVVALSDDATATAADDHPANALTTPKLRKALLAVLAVTRPVPGHPPYPGRPALLRDAVAVTRPTSVPAQYHIRGALRTLATLGWCVIDDSGTTLRPGPKLACWDSAWAREELPALLDRLELP